MTTLTRNMTMTDWMDHCKRQGVKRVQVVWDGSTHAWVVQGWLWVAQGLLMARITGSEVVEAMLSFAREIENLPVS
jgi:hypothetical protein